MRDSKQEVIAFYCPHCRGIRNGYPRYIEYKGNKYFVGWECLLCFNELHYEDRVEES